MSEHAPDRLWAGIDIPKTIAGVLAAVSAAVVGSFLGVAGTLVGAAVASIVGSVGTEIYHRSIERGKQRLAATFVTAPAAVGTPPVAAAEQESPSEPEPKASKRYRWGRVAMVAGALFVLAMGALSAFELTTGKTAADAVSGKAGSGTTIGNVLGGDKKKSNSPTVIKPSSDADPTGTASADPSAEPSADPSASTSTEPGADPSSTATTSPEPASTDTATTAPPAVDSGAGDQDTSQDGAGGGASADSPGGSGGGATVDGSASTPEPDSSGE
jgi:hypothetical protein